MSKIDFPVTVIFDANDYTPEQKDKAKEDLVHVCENLECIKLPNGACGISFPILNDGKKGTKPYDIKDFDYDNGEPIVSVSHLIAHCVSNGDVMQVGVNEKADLFVRARMEETWKVVEYTFRGWKPTLTKEQKLQEWAGLDNYAKFENETFRLGDLLGDRYGWSTKYHDRPIETKPHTVSRFLLTQTDDDDRMTPKFFQTLDAARHEMVEAVAGVTGDCFSKVMQAMSECLKAEAAPDEEGKTVAPKFTLYPMKAQCWDKNHRLSTFNIVEVSIPVTMSELALV